MPDGDRFERVLRGGGWRSAYKIAAGGGTDQRVIEKLGSACLSLINAENSDCARKMVSALDSALSTSSLPLFPTYADNASFESFQRNVDDIASEYGYGEFAQLCGRAAGRCFIESEHNSLAEIVNLEGAFARELISEVVHRNFFHAVRDGISANAGRDPETQRQWESKIVDGLATAADVFAKSLMTGRRMRIIRSEAIIPSAQVFNIERLRAFARLGSVTVAYQPKIYRERAYTFDFTGETAVRWNETDIGTEGQSTGFVLRDHSIANRLNQSLPAMYADLIDLAASVHLADRKALRGPANHGYARDLRLIVPVRCLDQWLSAPFRDTLFSVLGFMTQDHWQIEFRQRVNPGRNSETQDNLEICDGESPCEVGLYSGGLDSFAGTASAINSNRDARFLCVSVTSNFRHRQRQHDQLVMLQKAFGAKVTHIPVDYWLLNAETGRQEQTRRTRGFLFLLIGGVTALMAGQKNLFVYENGIGAINLRFDGSQVGIDNSRSVNPITLKLVSQLLSLAGGTQFSIVNRCLFQSKAEMCGSTAVAKVLEGISSTFSCDGFPVRRRQFAQCGFCTSCLLRRQALQSSALGAHDSEDYGCDLTSDNQQTAQHLRALRSMNVQALRIRAALDSPQPWKSLTVEFPELRRVAEAIGDGIDSLAVRQDLLRLYTQHVSDWRGFSALKHLQLQDVACAA